MKDLSKLNENEVFALYNRGEITWEEFENYFLTTSVWQRILGNNSAWSNAREATESVYQAARGNVSDNAVPK